MCLIDVLNRLSHYYYRLKTILYYRPQFAAIGDRSTIRSPLLISNPRFISIGSKVTIRDGARLEVVLCSPDDRPQLTIGDGCIIEQNVHIVCHHRVAIGSNVSITGNCSIVDVTHPFIGATGDVNIGSRIQEDEATVVIGDGVFIGMGTVVLPNVTIGNYSVIGANSVVSHSLPGHCLASGSPAKVICRIGSEAFGQKNSSDMAPIR